MKFYLLFHFLINLWREILVRIATPSARPRAFVSGSIVDLALKIINVMDCLRFLITYIITSVNVIVLGQS